MPLAAEAVEPNRNSPRLALRRRNYPVAVHLALFAAGTLAPVLLIVTWMLIDSARLRRDASLHDASTVVRQLNATIEVEVEDCIAVGQTLATSMALSKGDYAAFEEEARDVANRLDLVIVARDSSGRQIASTAAGGAIPLPENNEDTRTVDRLAAERRVPVVSDLRQATADGSPTVVVDVPVLIGKQVAAFIEVVLFPRRIAEILKRGLPEGWIAGVIGRDGRLIARSVDQDRFIGTINSAFLRAATGPRGVWSGTDREGEAIAGAYIRSRLSGWVVSVAVPESILNAPARWALLVLGWLVAASLAVSTGLGWKLSRRISLPIRDLVIRARELGEGRRPAETPSGVTEINDVAAALRAASVELDRRAAAAKQAADSVRDNEERLQLVQDTAGIATIDLNIAADRAVCSPLLHAMIALPIGEPVRIGDIATRVHPAERDGLEEAWRQLRDQGGPFAREFRILTPDGEERWVYARGRLDLADGRPVRLLAAGIDITERKRSEEHLRFLLRELSHRSKNLLAVIQAMAGQTAKSAESVDAFRRRFGERLMGIAASHDLLVNRNWLGASVEQLVHGQLSPFVDARDPRVRVNGPVVDLNAEATEALGLALHELATNSVKYGALRDQAGKVEVSWDVYGTREHGMMDGQASGRRFRMEWIEHTVVPVSPPTHSGFGRMVIEHTVETTFAGTVTLEFPPDGVRWRVDAPASCLAPNGRGTTT